jgi:hypothetical protein
MRVPERIRGGGDAADASLETADSGFARAAADARTAEPAPPPAGDIRTAPNGRVAASRAGSLAASWAARGWNSASFEGLARDLTREPPPVVDAAMARLPPGVRARVGEALGPVQLEHAARLHGQTQGRLDAIQHELEELGRSQGRLDDRGFTMEHARVAHGDMWPIRERVAEIQRYADAGLAVRGGEGWHSPVQARAVADGIISSPEDQERFARIAEAEREKAMTGWGLWRCTRV